MRSGVLLTLACVLALAGAGGNDEPPPAEPSRVSRIAILSPLDLELDPLLERTTVSERRYVAGQIHHLGCLEGHGVVLVRCGRSLVASAATTQAVLDHYDVSAVLVSGIAGGIDPGHDVGDVVVPARWAQYQEHVVARGRADGFDPGPRRRGATFEGFGAFFSRPQRLTLRRGDEETDELRFWFDVDPDLIETARRAGSSTRLERCSGEGQCAPGTPRVAIGGHGVSGNGFVDNSDYREWIWRTYEARAVDQETAAIAQVAYTNGVPFIAFRGLSDLAGGSEVPNRVLDLGGLAADNAATAVLGFLRAWPATAPAGD